MNRAVNLSGGSAIPACWSSGICRHQNRTSLSLGSKVPRCDVEVSLPFDPKELKASVSEAQTAACVTLLHVRTMGTEAEPLSPLSPPRLLKPTGFRTRPTSLSGRQRQRTRPPAHPYFCPLPVRRSDSESLCQWIADLEPWKMKAPVCVSLYC